MLPPGLWYHQTVGEEMRPDRIAYIWRKDGETRIRRAAKLFARGKIQLKDLDVITATAGRGRLPSKYADYIRTGNRASEIFGTSRARAGMVQSSGEGTF